MNTYANKLKLHMETLKDESVQVAPTLRVSQLAHQIAQWHETRYVPERWRPVMLGRIAALFGVSRELAAAALTVAGWIETRRSGRSLWQPPYIEQ